METKSTIWFNPSRWQRATVRQALLEGGRPDVARWASLTSDVVVSVKFKDPSPELDRYREALRCHDIEWGETRSRTFSHSDLRAAALLVLYVDTMAEDSEGGPADGTDYDLSTGCPHCGTGARQVSPLRLKPVELPTKGPVTQTENSEVLLAEPLAEKITEEGFTGAELRQATTPGGGPLPWYQLTASEELPPLDSSTEGLALQDQCPHCRRDGNYQNATWVDLVYDGSAVDVERLPDFARTHEYFGNTRIREPFSASAFAQPLLIVKPTVYEVFKRERVRKVKFEPVQLPQS